MDMRNFKVNLLIFDPSFILTVLLSGNKVYTKPVCPSTPHMKLYIARQGKQQLYTTDKKEAFNSALPQQNTNQNCVMVGRVYVKIHALHHVFIYFVVDLSSYYFIKFRLCRRINFSLNQTFRPHENLASKFFVRTSSQDKYCLIVLSSFKFCIIKIKSLLNLQIVDVA